MSISKPIIFFGTDAFSAVSLRELLSKGFTVAAVVTKPDSRKGRGRALQAPLVKEIALQHAVPVWQPAKVGDIVDNITTLSEKTGESPVGVLVSYGKIIPQSIIDLFEPGIINVHPSLLPKYRGPSPVEAAIVNGDTETGVTIMQLSAAMDAGPIYTQVAVPLHDTETAPELERHLAELGAQELCLTLPKIMNGAVQPTPQDESSAQYCQLLRKEDGLLVPESAVPDGSGTFTLTVTAEQAERRIRAFLAFPKTRAFLAGHPVVITKAHISATDCAKNALDIPCSDGRFVSVDELIGPSGKAMTAAAFLNGYARQK